jgi:hypothetical protein
MTCPICDEAIDSPDTIVLYTEDGPRPSHRECMLREVMGGIGHHLGHEYWCTQRDDPDAGLTRRQSAVMVAKLLELLGPNAMAANAAVIPINPTEEPPCPSTPI